jgi:serine/threonine protein kinase
MNVRKQIMRELQFMHDCNSKHIVSFYGAFMNGGDISICMEYMDVGSLDQIYKKHGPFHLDVLRKVGYAVSTHAIVVSKYLLFVNRLLMD